MMRRGVPLSLLMIDIDCFKRFNDHYGHGAGDDCLRLVARTIAGIIKRPGDLVARYGGEEFAVILSETDNQGAAFVAEAIRLAIDALNLPLLPERSHSEEMHLAGNLVQVFLHPSTLSF